MVIKGISGTKHFYIVKSTFVGCAYEDVDFGDCRKVCQGCVASSSTARCMPHVTPLYKYLPSSSSSLHNTYHGSSSIYNRNCTNDETIVIEPGCEITNKRCQCWPTLRLCRTNTIDDTDAPATTDIRWHFKTLEDCQLNLQNLIKIEMEFDEDYTIAPSTFTYKKLRRKRRSLRRRR
ncbi:unnamed protein product [Ceratitis capitata]|uniref:(Mediterranean fruit fly) hypothetical protein n=1 Tax=Ceratitis capitata TaxID=7213 RepID=A0A811V515_CERCA|nr:unnamed protein product [Ceratitis capitata]